MNNYHVITWFHKKFINLKLKPRADFSLPVIEPLNYIKKASCN